MRSGTEVSDRIKEIDRLIGGIDRRYEDGGGYGDYDYEYARDQDKRIELEMERSTLYWVLSDF